MVGLVDFNPQAVHVEHAGTSENANPPAKIRLRRGRIPECLNQKRRVESGRAHTQTEWCARVATRSRRDINSISSRVKTCGTEPIEGRGNEGSRQTRGTF